MAIIIKTSQKEFPNIMKSEGTYNQSHKCRTFPENNVKLQ